MSDYKYLGRNFKTFTPVKRFAPYSRVVINIDDDTSVSAGNDSGYTLVIDNPWGTQAMAENILRSLSGKAYQPFKSEDAQLDPAVELGDTLSIGGVCGVLYQQSAKLTAGSVSRISAPGEQEINHEYPYQSPTTRKFTRQVKTLRSELILAEGKIEAKVSRQGGDNASFGWLMELTGHTWYADGSPVMEVKRSGLKVEGEIIARSGQIGDCLIENGVLKIANANIDNLNASKINAGYLSVDRIESASLTGSKIAGATILGGSGGHIGGSTLTTWNTASGINTNLGYAAGYGAATVNGTSVYPNYFKAKSIYAVERVDTPRLAGVQNMTFEGRNVYSFTKDGITYMCLV